MQWITQDALNSWTAQNSRRAEELIPELVGKLILASCPTIDQCNLPYGTAIRYPGYDGKVQSDGFSVFVPSGISVWEIGTNQDPLKKFNDDYKKRTKNPENVIPADTTFVFVTSRIWNHTKTSDSVEDERNKEHKWKKVMILDAGKLALWLEKCPSVAAWLGNEIGRPISGVCTLHEYWQRKRLASGQKLVSQFFVYDRQSIITEIQTKVQYGAKQILVKADSSEEALLTIAAEAEELLQDNLIGKQSFSLKGFVERCLVIDSKEIFITTANQFPNALLIANFPLNARNLDEINNTVILLSGKDNCLSSIYQKHKSLVSIPSRNIHEFSDALKMLGYDSNEAYRIANDCKASFLDFYRSIAKKPSAKVPEWIHDKNVSALIPALLAGEWDERNESDKRTLEKLSGEDYNGYIAKIDTFLHGNDVPIITLDKRYACKAVSEMWELLFDKVRECDDVLNHFYETVVCVLTVPDIRFQKKIDWNAKQLEVYYTNTCSDSLKRGLIRSLAMLVEITGKLQGETPYFDIESLSEYTVERLLEKIRSEELWLSICQFIPALMEVAPQTLLGFLEEELRDEKSYVWSFIRDSEHYVYLLYGLEKALRMRSCTKRAVNILSLFVEKELKYPYSNTPLRSLLNYFCLWMPQGALNWAERKSLLAWLFEKHHAVAIKLLKLLLQKGNTVEELAVFEWRKYDVVQETECCSQEIDEAWVHNLYLTHLQPKAEEWEFVLSNVEIFPVEEYEMKLKKQQSRLSVVDRLYLTGKMHNTIERIKYRLKSEERETKSLNEVSSKLQELEQLLFPNELSRYRPYFANDYWGIRTLTNKEYSQDVKSIIQFLPLAEGNYSAYAKAISEIDMKKNLDWNILNEVKRIRPSVAAEIIRLFYECKGMTVFDEIRSSRSSQDLGWALSCIPMTKPITQYVKGQKDSECLKSYWENVNFSVINDVSDKDWVNECVEQMLSYSRPLTLINELAYVDWNNPKLIVKILEAAWPYYAKVNKNVIDNVQLSDHAIEAFFDKLKDADDLSLNEVALFEILYLHAFDPDRPLTYFTRRIYNDPMWYITLLRLTYYRDMGKLNYSGSSQMNYKNLPGLINLAFERVDGLPGMDADTKTMNVAILEKWVNKTVELAREYQCIQANDTVLGKILSLSPVGVNGLWPLEAVCEILEEHHSREVKSGFICGKRNQRGVYIVTYGIEEAKLAEYYSSCAKRLDAIYPFTADIVRCLGKTYQVQVNEEKNNAVMGYF